MSVRGAAISPDDVGARVTVRRRHGGRLTDVVGDLESWDADELAIRRSSGELVRVAATDVVAARVVGSSPLKARELESRSGRSWAAPDEEWLGRWWLRAAGGFTDRANSVRPLGDPSMPLDAAISHVETWYAHRGLRPLVRTVTGSTMDDALLARGWRLTRPAAMYTGTIAAMRRGLANTGGRSDVLLAPKPSAAWLGRYHDGAHDPHDPVVVSVLTSGAEPVFATIPAAETDHVAAHLPASAIGRAVVEPPWVGFSALEVAPGQRRQGLARAVMAALVEWAAQRGAVRGWLEVSLDNEAAITLYRALGFAEHHRYAYLQSPSA